MIRMLFILDRKLKYACTSICDAAHPVMVVATDLTTEIISLQAMSRSQSRNDFSQGNLIDPCHARAVSIP